MKRLNPVRELERRTAAGEVAPIPTAKPTPDNILRHNRKARRVTNSEIKDLQFRDRY